MGCRKVRAQADLLRIGTEEGRAVPGRARPGRGCYLCRDERCVRAAVKGGQIARALKSRASPPGLDEVLRWLDDMEPRV